MSANIKRFSRYGLTVLFGAFIAYSFTVNFRPGKIISSHFATSFIEMMTFIPFLFIIVGLLDVWFPRDKVERHIGPKAGIKGIAIMVLLAMLQAGPLYGAFPVSYLLYKKGAGVRNVFIYLGAFSSLKIPMLGMEIGYLGWRFSLARTLISLPLFIGIGYLMERLLRGHAFEVMNPGQKTEKEVPEGAIK